MKATGEILKIYFREKGIRGGNYRMVGMGLQFYDTKWKANGGNFCEATGRGRKNFNTE